MAVAMGHKRSRMVMDDEIGVRVLIALSWCSPCEHFKSNPAQPAVAALDAHKVACMRCVPYMKEPPAAECDRCDWCGRRGVTHFHTEGVTWGVIEVFGNACEACHEAFGRRVLPSADRGA